MEEMSPDVVVEEEAAEVATTAAAVVLVGATLVVEAMLGTEMSVVC